MNVHMWEHARDAGEPAIAGRARRRMRSGRAAGSLACGYEGAGPARRAGRDRRGAWTPCWRRKDLAGERVAGLGRARRARRSIRCATSPTTRAERWATRSPAWRAGAAPTSSLVSGPTDLPAAAGRAHACRHDGGGDAARARARVPRRHGAGDGRRGRRLPAGAGRRRASSRRARAPLSLELERTPDILRGPGGAQGPAARGRLRGGDARRRRRRHGASCARSGST